jgi:hypothetical protein
LKCRSLQDAALQRHGLRVDLEAPRGDGRTATVVQEPQALADQGLLLAWLLRGKLEDLRHLIGAQTTAILPVANFDFAKFQRIPGASASLSLITFRRARNLLGQLNARQGRVLNVVALVLEKLLDGLLLASIVGHLQRGSAFSRNGLDLEFGALAIGALAQDGSGDLDTFQEAKPFDADRVVQASQLGWIAPVAVSGADSVQVARNDEGSGGRINVDKELTVAHTDRAVEASPDLH